MTGAERITAERQRQIDVEGYDAEHDASEGCGGAALLQAADCYLGWATEQAQDDDPVKTYGRMPEWWPWEPRDWKPSEDPIRNLEKAGALIAAEIDRVLRERSKAS